MYVVYVVAYVSLNYRFHIWNLFKNFAIGNSLWSFMGILYQIQMISGEHRFFRAFV